MALRNILKEGDPTLRKHSREVTKFDERLHMILDDMRDTLDDANGLGLAGPQVGILRKLAIIIDTSGDEDVVVEVVNPEIIEQSGEQEGIEGCLSVPDVWGVVKRPMHVKVKAQDRYGKDFEIEADGLTARAFCHEIAHLNGELFIDVCERLLTSEEREKMYKQEESDE